MRVGKFARGVWASSASLGTSSNTSVAALVASCIPAVYCQALMRLYLDVLAAKMCGARTLENTGCALGQVLCFHSHRCAERNRNTRACRVATPGDTCRRAERAHECVCSK